MNSIVVNLMQVRTRIELAALAAKREPEDIELLLSVKPFLLQQWKKRCMLVNLLLVKTMFKRQ